MDAGQGFNTRFSAEFELRLDALTQLYQQQVVDLHAQLLAARMARVPESCPEVDTQLLAAREAVPQSCPDLSIDEAVEAAIADHAQPAGDAEVQAAGVAIDLEANDGESSTQETTSDASESVVAKELMIRPEFLEFSKIRSARDSIGGANTLISESSSSRRESSILDDAEEKPPSHWSWDPESNSRTVFEVTALLWLGYDALMVPYKLAWNIADEGVWVKLTWLSRCFWTVDLISNFFVAYRTPDAHLEKRIVKTAKNYLRGGFAFDFLIVGLDWFGVILIVGMQTLRFIRIGRLVRGLRQIVRALSRYYFWRMRLRAKEHQIVADISLMLLGLMLFNHFIACAWWTVTVWTHHDTDNSWYKEFNFDKQLGRNYEYSTSLHWAVTQFSPGSMEVNPKNSGERWFAVFILTVAMVLTSSFVATIASMVTAYRVSREEASRKFFVLKQFLKQQGVSDSLAVAVQIQVIFRVRETHLLKMKDVEYLKLTSQFVQDSVKYEISIKHLKRHIFFSSLCWCREEVVKRFCISALSPKDYSQGDEMFVKGDSGSSMYWLTHGSIRYSTSGVHNEVRVNAPDWLAEPALWITWEHIGSAEVLATCDVLVFPTDDLQRALTRHSDFAYVITDYCKTFYTYIVQPGIIYSDLPTVIDYQELMYRLPSRSREAVLKPIFAQLSSGSWGARQKKLESLWEEVDSGKCSLGIIDEEIVRTVFVVAVQMRAPRLGRCSRSSKKHDLDEKFLVQVGQLLMVDGSVKAKFTSPMLPATKQGKDDTTEGVVQKVLRTDFAEYVDTARVAWAEGLEYTSFIKESPSFGIRTRYLRTTIRANLPNGAELPTVAAARTDSWDINEQASLGQRCSMRGWAASLHPFKSNKMQVRAASHLAKHKDAIVICCPRDRKCNAKLYLWLHQNEFQDLSSDEAAPILEQWVGSLDSEGLREVVASQSSGGCQSSTLVVDLQ